MSKFYITTAIDYVNSVPHLGTAYEKIAADVIARYKRSQGYNTFFLMGADEHSLNVERQARNNDQSPQEYCDNMVTTFKEVWNKLDISFNDFIRTTERRHIEAVQYLLQKIFDKGDVYKGKYKGFYCVSCEAFLKEKDLIDGKCPTHNKEPQHIEEENYFFSLSKYQEPLLSYIEKNPDFIQPQIRLNEVINVLKGGLEDISITRSTVGWGIPVPFDPRHVVYVWFDALINYISGIGYPKMDGNFSRFWPCDLHIIGKDITRFHCIIWPAMLMSAGIELPKKVWGHGFVYLGAEKMSKTQGTVIDPLEIVQKYGADSIRYFLMREVPFDRDGEFTWDKFKARYQSDLANDLGNLVNRVLSMVHRYNKGILQKRIRPENDLVNTVGISVSEYKKYMEEYQLSQALISVWNIIGRANRYVEESKPWVLNKEKKIDELHFMLYNLVESIRIISVLIEPFMPKTASEIRAQIGQDVSQSESWGQLPDGFCIGEPKVLFLQVE